MFGRGKVFTATYLYLFYLHAYIFSHNNKFLIGVWYFDREVSCCLASPPLKGYSSKLVDIKVDVLSSINQRLSENKEKEVAWSSFFFCPRTLFIPSSLARRRSSTDNWNADTSRFYAPGRESILAKLNLIPTTTGAAWKRKSTRNV